MKFIMVFFLIFVFFDLCPAEDLSQPVITEDEPVLGRQETPDKQGAVVLKSKITYEASDLRDPFKKYSETDISQPQESGAPVLPEMTVSGERNSCDALATKSLRMVSSCDCRVTSRTNKNTCPSPYGTP